MDYTLYRKTFFYADIIVLKDDGTPQDVTGWTFDSLIKATPTASAALTTLTNTASLSATGIRLVDAANGAIRYQVSMADTDALPTADALAYDLIGTDGSGAKSWEQAGSIESKTTVTLG
jgi:hypothetical protein|tara:strand:+ start:1693 stop:2049 length:357 start_codon:yes stop_codon:yes gene_type:complete